MPSIPVTVSIENLAPNNGNFLTPPWVGFHNGNFDTFDRGRPASAGLERLAEDGTTELISQEFNLSQFGSTQGQLEIDNPIFPGQIALGRFVLDSDNPASRYLNYAAMVFPSNDGFIANDDPKSHPVFNAAGNFIGADFIVSGNQVLDAGTEVNDEIPENITFFPRQTSDLGSKQNGVVRIHSGLKSADQDRILADPLFANANFKTPDYQIARIKIVQDKLGSNANNLINGSADSESILGLAGNDVLLGLQGTDLVFGNQGNDNINGNQGDDRLYAGQGNDTAYGGQGRDFVSGDRGNDLIFGNRENDILVGGEGDDNIYGGQGDDGVFGAPLPETTNAATFQLQEAQEVGDTPVPDTPATGTVTVGLVRNELLVNGTFSNLTSALRTVGDIDVEGNAPSSVHIHFGAAGFNGSIVRNLTVAETGNNSGTLSGNFLLSPGEIAAVLAGDYYINLHTQNNPSGELRGQMRLQVPAATGNDNLFGDNGDDALVGSAGNDVMDGGAGNDTLTSSTGNDVIVFAPGNGTDLILDFENGRDKFGLNEGLTFEQLTIAQGTSEDATSLESRNHTLVRVTATGELLGAIAFTPLALIEAGDFFPLG